MVATVARIQATLPEEDKSGAGILVSNYGEAGAINLYGATYGLPRAISGVNSYWLRGYGDPPPRTVIVVGYSRSDVDSAFKSCVHAGHITNSHGVENEETKFHPDIFVCRGLLKPWPEFWTTFRQFA